MRQRLKGLSKKDLGLLHDLAESSWQPGETGFALGAYRPSTGEGTYTSEIYRGREGLGDPSQVAQKGLAQVQGSSQGLLSDESMFQEAPETVSRAEFEEQQQAQQGGQQGQQLLDPMQMAMQYMGTPEGYRADILQEMFPNFGPDKIAGLSRQMFMRDAARFARDLIPLYNQRMQMQMQQMKGIQDQAAERRKLKNQMILERYKAGLQTAGRKKEFDRYMDPEGNIHSIEKGKPIPKGFTPVSTGQIIEGTTEKGLKKDIISRTGKVIDLGESAQKNLMELDNLDALLESNLETNVLAPYKQKVGKILGLFGINLSGLEESEAFEAFSNRIVTASMEALKGSMSEKELDFLVKMAPGLAKEGLTNRAIIAVLRNKAQRDIKMRDLAVEYRSKSLKAEKARRSFLPWSEYKKKHFDEKPFNLDLRKKLKEMRAKNKKKIKTIVWKPQEKKRGEELINRWRRN